MLAAAVAVVNAIVAAVAYTYVIYGGTVLH